MKLNPNIFSELSGWNVPVYLHPTIMVHMVVSSLSVSQSIFCPCFAHLTAFSMAGSKTAPEWKGPSRRRLSSWSWIARLGRQSNFHDLFKHGEVPQLFSGCWILRRQVPKVLVKTSEKLAVCRQCGCMFQSWQWTTQFFGYAQSWHIPTDSDRRVTCIPCVFLF